MKTRGSLLVSLLLVFLLLPPPADAGGHANASSSDAQRDGDKDHVDLQSDSTGTLPVFVAEALAGSPRLQAARTRAEGAESKIAQTGAWDDPQVGVEFFATPVTSANPFRDGMETDYFVQQMIPLFGKKGLMSDAASAAARMEGQTTAMAERDLVVEVKKAYAMLYAAQKKLEINAEIRRLLVQIAESARVKYSVGAVSQADVLKAEVELDKLQNERNELGQERENAAAMLNALRGVPAGRIVGRVAEPPLVKVALSVEDLTADALTNRPEILGMNEQLAMNRVDARAADREKLPDLMVRGTYKKMTEGTDQWAAMFSINVPIAPWSAGKYSGKSEERALAARATEQSLADMRYMVQAEVRDAWGKTSARWEELARFRESILPRAEQSLRSDLTAYETNGVDFLSLLESFRMLQMLKMEEAMLVGEYIANVAQLERAVGRDLQ